MRLTLFDLDGTLLPIDSDHAFGEFMVRIGWADEQEHRRLNDRFFQDYQAGSLDMDAYIDFATAAWRHRNEGEIREMSERFMREVVAPALRPQAHALVDQHRIRGDELAIITATNDFITAPIARAFSVPTLLATELQRDERGRATGRIRGTPALREGKIERLLQWLRADGRSLDDFEEVTFYSDSTNDLPLLERVSVPVATNPGEPLQRIATQRGWRILRLFE